MLVKDILDLISDTWGVVYLKVENGELPITNIVENKVYVCGKHSLFGIEIEEALENVTGEVVVIVDV